MTAKEMLTRYYELEERIHGIDIMLDDYRNKYQVSGTGLGVQGGSKVSFIEADADKRQALIKERDGYEEERRGIWNEIQPMLIKLKAQESLVITCRYWLHKTWDEVTEQIYWSREDFVADRERYKQLVFVYHNAGVKKLNDLLK